MVIVVNGKNEEISGPISLLDFLKSKKIHPDRVVTELNTTIIEKNLLEDITLKENDILEILRFVGGG